MDDCAGLVELFETTEEASISEASTMDTETSETSDRRRTIGSAIGETNKTDYSVYKVIDAGTGSEKVIVIVDAKTTFTVHSLAQTIGYYSAY